MGKQDYQQNLVSIITPVYNAEVFIGQTIRSVQAQTHREWELILIDDCSTDQSQDIIQRYAGQDQRIRYYRLPQNSGAAIARNTAIGLARGAFMAFLDSDDLWTADKLARQLAFMEDKRCAFSFTRISMIDENGETVKADVPIPERVTYQYLLRHTVIATSTVLLDRRQTGPFKMPLRRGGQDYATWLQLLRNIDCAYGLNESLTSYRTRSNSLSSNKLKSVRQVYEIQTMDEHISPWAALFNTGCFCLYAFKKHFL